MTRVTKFADKEVVMSSRDLAAPQLELQERLTPKWVCMSRVLSAVTSALSRVDEHVLELGESDRKYHDSRMQCFNRDNILPVSFVMD